MLETPFDADSGAVQRLAQAFSQATRTEHVYDSALPAVLTDPRTGADSLYLFPGVGATTSVLALTTPDLPLQDVVTFADGVSDLHTAIPLQTGPGQPAELAIWQLSNRSAGLYRRNGSKLEPLFRWPSDPLGDAVSTDLDGDGAFEVYAGTLAYQRELRVMRQQPSGGWTLENAHPPTNLAGSDIMALEATDLDHDGFFELAVAAGAWGAYDVRLLEPDAFGAPALTGRRKLGTVGGLAVLPGESDRLVALKVDTYPNPQMFAAGSPFGEPAGIYLLDRSDTGLAVDQYLPLPADWVAKRVLVADLDGDGLSDLIVGKQRVDPDRTLVFLQQIDGSFQELTLLGVLPLAAANLDDDPEDELIVSVNNDGRRIWVLGAGDQSLPPLERSRPSRAAPPSADPSVIDAWQQAEDLAAIGLVDSAVERLRQISELTLSPEIIAAALVRGADLLLADGRPLQAAGMYEDASAQEGGRRIEALSAAVGAWRSTNHFEEALRLIERLLAAPGLSASDRAGWERERASLQVRLDPSKSWRINFSRPLEAGWHFSRPEGIRWQKSAGSLRMEFIERASGEEMARFPVRWDGGPLTLEADLTLERLEWGAGVSVNLRSEDGALMGLSARGSGGQSQLNQLLGCQTKQSGPGQIRPVDSPETPRRVAIRFDLLEDGQFRCTGTRPDTGEILWSNAWQGVRPRPGNWYLELKGNDEGWTGPMRARATLHSIQLRGVQRLEPGGPQSSWQRALLALVNGDAGQALELVRDASAPSPIDRELVRYRALQDLGRPLEAGEALQTALEAGLARDPARREQLVAVLREQPEQLNPVLQKLLGWDDWLEVFVSAWRVVANMHPRDPLVRNTLMLSLGDQVQQRRPRGDVIAFVELLAARAQGWQVAGQWGAARADLRRTIALLEGLMSSSPTDAALVMRARRALGGCHALLAEVEMEAGDREGAMGQVELALARSAMPEITADMFKANPLLAPLHGRSDWVRLMDDRLE